MAKANIPSQFNSGMISLSETVGSFADISLKTIIGANTATGMVL